MQPDKVQFVGHSCVWITLDGQHFLVDANFSTRLLGFMKRHSPVGIDLGDLPEFSALAVTHAHYDHLDLFSYKYFPQDRTILAPVGLKGLIGRFLHHPVVELKTGDTHQVGTVKITAVPTRHYGFRVSGLRYTQCNGYVFQGAHRAVYVPGDSAYGPHFAEIGARFPIDVACLPIGAYHPRWLFKSQTMDPPEAIAAFKDLKAKKMLPIHWGGFRLGFEPLDEPIQRLKSLAKLEFVEDALHVLNPGEKILL